jgi:6-phosphogluconolactonase
MNSEPPATKFADLESLSRTLANEIAASLRAAIAARGLASLVVSGGKSPTRLFELLRAQTLDWSRVCIALADERWVDPTDAGSNEKLLRDVLLQGPAAAARFLGLKNGAPTPDMGAVSAWETFARVPMCSCSAWAMTVTPHPCSRARRIYRAR